GAGPAHDDRAAAAGTDTRAGAPARRGDTADAAGDSGAVAAAGRVDDPDAGSGAGAVPRARYGRLANLTLESGRFAEARAAGTTGPPTKLPRDGASPPPLPAPVSARGHAGLGRHLAPEAR